MDLQLPVANSMCEFSVWECLYLRYNDYNCCMNHSSFIVKIGSENCLTMTEKIRTL